MGRVTIFTKMSASCHASISTVSQSSNYMLNVHNFQLHFICQWPVAVTSCRHRDVGCKAGGVLWGWEGCCFWSRGTPPSVDPQDQVNSWHPHLGGANQPLPRSFWLVSLRYHVVPLVDCNRKRTISAMQCCSCCCWWMLLYTLFSTLEQTCCAHMWFYMSG